MDGRSHHRLTPQTGEEPVDIEEAFGITTEEIQEALNTEPAYTQMTLDEYPSTTENGDEPGSPERNSQPGTRNTHIAQGYTESPDSWDERRRGGLPGSSMTGSGW